MKTILMLHFGPHVNCILVGSWKKVFELLRALDTLQRATSVRVRWGAEI